MQCVETIRMLSVESASASRVAPYMMVNDMVDAAGRGAFHHLLDILAANDGRWC